LRENAHALSEQFFVWGSIGRKDNQKKKITLNTIVKKQGLKCLYQEAFCIGTWQAMWSKM
jgi:hypothetical protein